MPLQHRETEKLGDLLKRWRVRLGITQQKMGETVHRDASTISRIERNSYIPDQDSLEKILDALDALATDETDKKDLAQDKSKFLALRQTRQMICPPEPVTLLDRVAIAISAFIGSLVMVAVRRWLVEQVPGREPPWARELLWGTAIGVGFALGLMILKIAPAWNTAQAQVQQTRGRTRWALFVHSLWKRFKKLLHRLLLPVAGGIFGSLCWICIRAFVTQAPMSSLGETTLWSFSYTLGFVLPFLSLPLGQTRLLNEIHSKRGLETRAGSAAITVVLTVLIALVAHIVVSSLFPNLIQEQIDIAVSQSVQAGWAIGLALMY